MAAFRPRALEHVEFPYVYLDATYLHVRNHASQVVSMAVVVATGITAPARPREVLGLDVGDSPEIREDEAFWRGFLTALKQRGLTGVKLVVSDQHAGLVKALRRCLQGAAHQRCRVHFARNLLAHVPKSHADPVLAWSLRCSAPSSPSPTPRPWPQPGTTSVTSSPNGSPRSTR